MSGISIHFDLMTAINEMIDGLDFDWLSDTGAIIQEAWSYQQGVQQLPFISISPFGQEVSEDWTDSEDMTHYPTLVAIIGKTSSATLEERLGWREQLLRRFRNRDFPEFVENFNTIPKPLNIVDRDAFKDGMFVSAILVMSMCDTARLT